MVKAVAEHLRSPVGGTTHSPEECRKRAGKMRESMFGTQGKQVSVDVGAGCQRKRWHGNKCKEANNTGMVMRVGTQAVSGNGEGMTGRGDICHCVGSTLPTNTWVEPCHVKPVLQD